MLDVTVCHAGDRLLDSLISPGAPFPGFVLSLFRGAGLLDFAFEEAGFTVIAGPDPLWGGDIRRFHPPAGVFDGVIGGPPCQSHSALRNLTKQRGHAPSFEDLIPEYERVVAEAAPRWFLMEEVPPARLPAIPGYRVTSRVWNNRWAPDVPGGSVGAKQHRTRRFSFGSCEGVELHPVEAAALNPEWSHAVTGDMRAVPPGERIRHKTKAAMTPIPAMCALQGLPPDHFLHSPFRASAIRRMVGNGVPLMTGRAYAQAIRAAMYGCGQRGEAQ